MGQGERCAPGFEALAATAQPHLDDAGGGALCVYVDGAAVLDIWAGQRDPSAGLPWQRDTMAMSWSTTKGVASTALHMLADRGELDYDAPVAGYWPDFGTNGKDAITIRHVMAMEAGLYDVRHLIDGPHQLLDHRAMADALAAAHPAHEPGAANGYHAWTYGWLVGEIVRCITGDSLGAFVRARMAEPLGLDGCYIGTPADQVDRVARRPSLRAESRALRDAAKLADPVTRLAGFSPARIGAAFAPRDAHDLIPGPAFLAAEVPSVNGVFTARSLARLYAALGSDDGVDGIRLWSPETRRRATTPQNHRRDLVLPMRVRWRMGYHPLLRTRRPSPTAFGFGKDSFLEFCPNCLEGICSLAAL